MDRNGTIWVDVEDFLASLAFSPRPSGTQRLAFELTRALLERAGAGRVRFVRRAPAGSGRLLGEVSWSDVSACIQQHSGRTPLEATDRGHAARREVQQVLQTLPDHLRGPLFRAGLLQVQARRSWREVAVFLRRRRRPKAVRAALHRTGLDSFADSVRHGDILLVLGAPWTVPGFAKLLAAVKQRYGLAPHLLLHDLLPVRHPEWCTKRLAGSFAAWLEESLPLFDGLMSVSRHTAADVAAYAGERGLSLAGPVRPIPIGTGLEPIGLGARPGADLPRPGSYVLCVATLEARQNHALPVRVWRHLYDEIRAGRRAPDSLPDLVFAGRVGLLAADLLEQLDNMRWLAGRIRLVPDPTDADLHALYEGCLFTVFPSWFEGWSMPIGESLAFGKPCLASSAAALPEAGGDLCRYFDPGDTKSALRAVAAVLDAPGALQAWQDRVRREFHPTPWSQTAQAVLDHLGMAEAKLLVAS